MARNVLFVTVGDEERASTRYRVLNYLPYLSPFDIIVSKKSDRKIININKINEILYYPQLIKMASKFDIIYLQKVFIPNQVLKILNKRTKVVFDFDDALYASKPWSQRRIWFRKRKLNKTLTGVSAVVTGGPYLTDYAEKFNENVFTIPTPIPKSEYDAARHQKHNSSDNNVVIGWIGNPENLWYLKNVSDLLREVLEKHSNLNLHIVTANNNHQPLEDRKGKDVFYKEWSLDVELDLVAQFDIGIRPLTNDEWTKGKGGFTSVVQNLAMGVPVVASPVGMLQDIVEHGSNGYLANDRTEWVECLDKLIESPNLRSEFAQNAVQSIGENRLWTHQLAKELKKVLSDDGQ